MHSTTDNDRDGEPVDSGCLRTSNNSNCDYAESGNSIAVTASQASISPRHHTVHHTHPYGRSTAAATTISNRNTNANTNANTPVDPAPRQISDASCQATTSIRGGGSSEESQAQFQARSRINTSNTSRVFPVASILTPTSADSTTYTNPDTSISTNHMRDLTLNQSLSPASYLPLLACSVCGPTSLLTSPTTLQCGHTVCASHILPHTHPAPSPPISSSSKLKLDSTSASASTLASFDDQIQPPPSTSPSASGLYSSPIPSPSSNSTSCQATAPTCPLQTCSSNLPSSHGHLRSPYQTMLSMHTTPRIPATSRVAFFPAPLPASGVPGPAYVPGKVDVTVSKIITLVTRAAALGNWDGCGEGEDSSASAGVSGVEGRSGGDSVTEDENEDEDETDVPSHPSYPSISHPHSRSHDLSPSPSPPGSPSPGSLPTHQRPRKRARWTSNVASDAELDPALVNLGGIGKSEMKAKTKTQSLENKNGSKGERTENKDRTSPQTKFEKDLMAELTCEICFMLLYQPITTPCQHTFCFKCLQRSLDHNTSCPLCRTDLIPQAPASATNISNTVFISHAHTNRQSQVSQPQADLETESEEHGYPATNKLLLSILLKAFPSVYASKSSLSSYHANNITNEEEIKRRRLDTPIFVCQLSFPGTPTVLHFFEPKYKLMLRRCLESSNPCFGMIMPPRVAPLPGSAQSRRTGGGDGNDFGTMLEIRSVQMLSDGRSMVETWGTHRFRILESDSLDGYMIGRIERVDDFEEELEDLASASAETISGGVLATRPFTPLERDGNILKRLLTPSASPRTPYLSSQSSARTNAELISICRVFLDQVRHGTAPWIVQRLNNIYGPMPAADADLSAFSFWMALVLPIDAHEKAKLLPIRSARLRLRLVVHWIEQLNENWWFSNGCVVL